MGYILTKISSKGQIWIPVEVKEFLNLKENQQIYFNLESTEKIVWLTTEEILTGGSSKKVSLNNDLLTIPKKIRDALQLNTQDIIEFGYDNKKEHVFFKKKQETFICPVCLGEGKVDELTCIVCFQSGAVEKIGIMQELARIFTKTRVYNINISLTSNEMDTESGKLTQLEFPKVKVISSSTIYPQKIIDLFQDYYQVRIIEEFTPKSISDPEKFCNPTDILLNEILTLLNTKEAKEKVYNWFRYERNIFSPEETLDTN